MYYITILSIAIFTNGCGIYCLKRTWIGGNHAQSEIEKRNCEGLIFPKTYFPVLFLNSRIENNLQLPSTGLIAINDGAKITFDSKKKSCKEIELTNDFSNRPNNWDPLPNRAIPFLDRYPCQWDDIVIPESDTLGIKPWPKLAANSFTVFGRNITPQDVETFSTLDLPLNLELSPVKCNEDICQCHNGGNCYSMATYYEDFASWPEIQDEIYCEGSIKPLRSCHRICGAVIISRWVNMPVKLEILKLLQEQTTVDYYNGLGEHGDVSQVVIVDKTVESGGKYTRDVMDKVKIILDGAKSKEKKIEVLYKQGKTEEGAEDFVTGSQYPSFRITVISSGAPIISGSFFTSGFGLLLIALLVNVLMFSTIYAVFMTNAKNFDIRTFRINPATFRPFLFARFDNANDASDEEDARRVDISFRRTRESNGSSSSSLSTNTNIVQLEAPDEGALERQKSSDRSFDNPLYGKQIEEIEVHLHEEVARADNEEQNEQRSERNAPKKERKVNQDKGKKRQLVNEEELTALQHLGECSKQPETSSNNPEEQQDKENEELQDPHAKEMVNAQEMLKFIEDNLQQVDLLDDQL